MNVSALPVPAPIDRTEDQAFSDPLRSQDRLRIAAVIDAASVSGPGRQLVALADALRSRSVDLTVVTFARGASSHRGFRDYLRENNVPCEVIRERALIDPLAVARLATLLSKLDPHLIQTHGYKPAAFVWLLRRFSQPWKWIAFFHGATSENAKVRMYNRLHDRVLRGADEVVIMTTRQRSHVRNGNVRVIYNAVLELPAAPDAAFTARLRGLAIPAPRLLVLGRLSHEKGVDVMLHGLRRSVSSGFPVGLMVVGDGPERERLAKLASDLAVSEMVAFFSTTTDVDAALASCDLLVIPSRSEGLPNVLLESLAHDRPVLATDVGAVREVLGDTDAGVIVPPESPAALSEAIPRALALRDNPQASQARRAIVERFSLDARVAAHLLLYHDVLGRSG